MIHLKLKVAFFHKIYYLLPPTVSPPSTPTSPRPRLLANTVLSPIIDQLQSYQRSKVIKKTMAYQMNATVAHQIVNSFPVLYFQSTNYPP